MTRERLTIFDTTLRDGEQSPGVTLSPSEKLHIAHALASLGVDVIEAGFPAASTDDAEAVRGIAEEMAKTDRVSPPAICALARANRKDIDAAWQAVAPAAKPRFHTFLATSPVHMRYKLEMTEGEVLGRIGDAVTYARCLCEDIEFTPEDSTRSDPEFLHAAIEVAIEAGASTINIADTVGWALPDELGALIGGIRSSVNLGDVVLSVHTHDDLGLATANALAGVAAGVRQVEATINGIGERAGNAALEEVVMALRTRGDHLPLETGVDATQLMAVSRLVREYTGIDVQRNKAIVGDNAFAHEAGIHQDGLLKHVDTYEIVRPQAVGAKGTELVLGKHSGRHALKVRLQSLGLEVTDQQLEVALTQLKAIAGTKRRISDEDLRGIIFDAELRAS